MLLFLKGSTKIFEVVEVEAASFVGGVSLNATGDGSSLDVTHLSVSMQLSGLAVSLIDNRPREVMNLVVNNIRLVYEDGTKETRYGLDVQRVQIDNMLYNALYPIVLWPKQPDSTAFAHVAVNQAKGHAGITFFNGFELVLQEMDIRVDEAFVTHFLAAVHEIISEERSNEEIDLSNVAVPVADYRRDTISTGDMVYARVLYIGPISMQVSYSSCSWAKIHVPGDIGAQLEDYLDYLNEVNGVYINLGMLNLDDAYHSRQALSWLVFQHYLWQLL